MPHGSKSHVGRRVKPFRETLGALEHDPGAGSGHNSMIRRRIHTVSSSTFLFAALVGGCRAGLRETLAHQDVDVQTCLAESRVQLRRLAPMHRCMGIFDGAASNELLLLTC